MVQVLSEEKINEYNTKKENKPQEYEALLIKLEKEIRGHIQTENQVKLYAETLQNNVEELEIENKILKEKLKSEENMKININSNTTDTTKDKFVELKNELEKSKKVLKSYEIQNLKLSENERKLKSKLVKELKLMNQKDIRYKKEIAFLKKKVSSYEKKLTILLGEDYLNNNNYNNNNYDQSQFSSNSNMKRTNYNITQDFSNNFYISNSNIKSSKAFLNINNKNNIPISNSSKHNKNIYYNKVFEETKNVSRTYRTNKKENSNHKNGPALSASSSMEKIERYLMNKFAKTQLHYKSKMNIMSSASKRPNKKISSPYNKSLVENELNGYLSHNNKLQMNDSALNNLPSKKKRKNNRHKSVENISKLIRSKNKQEILKNILMSNNNSAFNINIKKSSIVYPKENLKKSPNTCNLKGRIKHSENNDGIGININCGGKVINNNINIYTHTLRQDNNNNVYIKGNNEKALRSVIKANSGNCSARDYYSNKYSNEYLNRKYSLNKKKGN